MSNSSSADRPSCSCHNKMWSHFKGSKIFPLLLSRNTKCLLAEVVSSSPWWYKKKMLVRPEQHKLRRCKMQIVKPIEIQKLQIVTYACEVLAINNNLECWSVPQPLSSFKVTWTNTVKVYCCPHLFERMKRDVLPPLIWLDCQWQVASFFFLLYFFGPSVCFACIGGLEQWMSLIEWAVHYSVASHSTNLCITAPVHHSYAFCQPTFSNLVPVQPWPFSKGQRSSTRAISGFCLYLTFKNKLSYKDFSLLVYIHTPLKLVKTPRKRTCAFTMSI